MVELLSWPGLSFILLITNYDLNQEIDMDLEYGEAAAAAPSTTAGTNGITVPASKSNKTVLSLQVQGKLLRR